MADQRTVQLNLIAKTEGTDKASREIQQIASSATTLEKALAQAARGDQIQRIGTEFGNLAKKTKDVATNVAALNKQLKELGASEDEIKNAANAFSSAQTGGPSNQLGRIGSELRALPSTQIPGLSVSSDQVAGLIRLSGAIVGISEKAAQATRIGTLLTPVLGSTAAGFTAMAAAVLPVAAVFAGFVVAIGELQKRTAEATEALERTFDARDSIDEFVRSGATAEDALKRQAELQAIATDARENANEAELKAAADFEKRSKLVGGGLTASLQDLTAINSQGQAFAERVKETEDAALDAEAELADLNLQLEQGAFAAATAAEAEKKLAEERSKTALASADSAGKELAAQQKALASTEEANQKRLTTIEDEKAVIQKQIDVLTESGVTSEDVTAKIKALEASLGLLGKESAFISDTALEASRQADAEKKAKKDAEDAAKKAVQAQEQYNKAVESASKTYKQSLQDIGTRFTQTLVDNQLKFNRDLDDIGTKYRRDEYDLTIKAQRAERDALQDQLNDIEKIRDDALKEEQDAIREGDFKALFLARQKTAETVADEQEAVDLSAQQRQQDLQDAREDLLRNAQRTRSDRVQAYDRQAVDARTAQGRELAQARLTQQRALQQASESLRAELTLRGEFWNAALKQTQAAQANMLKVLQGGAGQGPNQSTSPYAGGFSGPFTTAVRK